MEQNRNSRHQDDDNRVSGNNDYDRNKNYNDWDRNYNNRNKDNDRDADYHGYNRNAYSSDRDRDYRNNQNEQTNDRSYNRPNSSYMNSDYNGYRHGNDYYNNRYRNEGWRDNYRNEDRDWWDRTKDEVSSWFGDDGARRRRRKDEFREGEHKGKGPKNYSRSTERIKEDASDRLSDDSLLDASNIDIEVKDNELTLSGTVNSRFEKRRAEDLVENVSGVSNVQNNLRVKDNNSEKSDYGKSDFGTNVDTSDSLYGGLQNREKGSK